MFQLIIEIAGPFLTPPDNDDIEWNSRRKLDDYGNVFRQKPPERTHRFIQQTKALFLAMNRIAHQQSSVLIPVIIPELIQIDRSTAPPFIRRPEELDLEKPQRIFTEFFHENGIPYIDLLPAIKKRCWRLEPQMVKKSKFTRHYIKIASEFSFMPLSRHIPVYFPHCLDKEALHANKSSFLEIYRVDWTTN